mgnify:FL=1|jgi:hypothetical protein
MNERVTPAPIKIMSTNENSDLTCWDMEDAKEYVKVYMTYEMQIKDLQESRREWSKDFLDEKGLPKKELSTALSAAKKELDMDVVSEIFNNITEMV